MKTDQDIRRSIEEKRQDYIDAALFIWDHPENIFEEYRSSACLAGAFKKERFPAQRESRRPGYGLCGGVGKRQADYRIYGGI